VAVEAAQIRKSAWGLRREEGDGTDRWGRAVSGVREGEVLRVRRAEEGAAEWAGLSARAGKGGGVGWAERPSGPGRKE